jgi:hypothetical protein
MHFDLPIGSPTTRLWLAILDQAVHDARLKTPRTAEERWAKKDATQWFHARGVTTGSFQWMCEVLLKKNPDRVLAALKLTKEDIYPDVNYHEIKSTRAQRALRAARDAARPRGPDGKLIRGRPAAANPSRRAIISRRYREKQLALGLAKK